VPTLKSSVALGELLVWQLECVKVVRESLVYDHILDAVMVLALEPLANEPYIFSSWYANDLAVSLPVALAHVV